MSRILVVDNEPDMCWALENIRERRVWAFGHCCTLMDALSFAGKCSESHPRDDLRRVTSLATPPRTGAESVFKDFPGDLAFGKEV